MTIEITIKAPRAGGKTITAQAIRFALRRLGATVQVTDEELTPRAMADVENKVATSLTWGENLMQDKTVRIKTINAD